MALNYNAPIDGRPSTIDGDGSKSGQMNDFKYLRTALIEQKKKAVFSQLASTENMPKHYGKTIKLYHYMPVLDDRNVNDQGIDATGAVIKPGSGNLYGSSKDIGTIVGKMPTLTEQGGRVNRIGFTRIVREGKLHKFGYFYDFTKETLDFDSDPELKSHLARELITSAQQVQEDMLQIDLLNAAGVTVYTGKATQDDQMTPEGADADKCIVNYRTFMRLDQILTENRCPTDTKIITGTRLTDTKVLPSCRVAYVGSEVVPLLQEMKDLFDNKAFIEAQHYAAGTSLLAGEIGSIGKFRFVQAENMFHWAGKGKAVSSNPGYRATGNKYDIFPILVVGNESFATIGFQGDGKTGKFNVLTKMPGRETASREDPYGELGFSSIKWYYGFLCKRPERIAVIKTCAPI